MNPPDCPAVRVVGFGVAEMLKSGRGLYSVIATVRTCPPLLPLTVIVAGSEAGEPVCEIVRTELPEPPGTGFVAKLAVNPAGGFADKVTLPVNPLTGDTVIVVVLDWFGGIFRDVGPAVTRKS